MSPLFLLGRALEFPNGELFIQWKKNGKWLKTTMLTLSRGEWNGLLQ
jgi:hypothetical protein